MNKLLVAAIIATAAILLGACGGDDDDAGGGGTTTEATTATTGASMSIDEAADRWTELGDEYNPLRTELADQVAEADSDGDRGERARLLKELADLLAEDSRATAAVKWPAEVEDEVDEWLSANSELMVAVRALAEDAISDAEFVQAAVALSAAVERVRVALGLPPSS